MTGTERPRGFVEVLRERADRQGERRAYGFVADAHDDETWLSYAELERRARAVAVALGQAAQPGDRVLLAMPAGLDYVAGFFGSLFAGMVAVPAYPPGARARARGDGRLDAIVTDAEPAVALASRHTIDSKVDSRGNGGPQWIASDEIPLSLAGDWRERGTDPDSLAALQYTSGSTAAARGVMLSQANLVHNSGFIRDWFGHDETSLACSWLPPFHDMGLIGGILQPMYAGFPAVLMSPATFAREPARWLRAVSRHRATSSGGPSFAYELCAGLADEDLVGVDLSGWRVAFLGAEPVRAAHLAAFAARFRGYGFRPEAFFPCYGLAEATLMVTGAARGAGATVRRYAAQSLRRNEVRRAEEGGEAARPLVSCGTPAADQRLIIVDPDSGEPSPAGIIGEIWVSGPSVAGGYWHRSEQSAATFGGRLAGHPETWLRTGDLGFIDDGELFVTGRRKDLLIVRGTNHYPQDVEQTIERSHPALLAMGAVFAVDDGDEERVVAVHEVHRHTEAGQLPEVAARARAAVIAAHELAPYAVVLVRQGSVPRTSSGKVQRSLCRDRYLVGDLPVLYTDAPGPAARDGASVGAVASPAAPAPAGLIPAGFAPAGPTPAAAALRTALDLLPDPAARASVIAGYLGPVLAGLVRLPAEKVQPDTPLLAVGLDSLAAQRLSHTVARDLGRVLPLERILEVETVADLAALLAGTTAPAHMATVSTVDSTASGLPLSVTQQRIWFVEHLGTVGAAYHIAAGVRVRGELDLDALRAAVLALVRRHESLRVAIRVEAGLPRQSVAEVDAIDLAIVDVEPGGDATAALREWAATPFDLTRPPLVRVAVARLDASDHIVGCVVHHVASDGWSMGLLLRDLGTAYAVAAGGGDPDLGPAPLDHAAVIAAQAAASGVGEMAGAASTELASADPASADLGYWRSRLADLPMLDLPTDRARPARLSYRGGRHDVIVPADLVGRLTALATRQNSTPFVVLLAAWQLLLARYTGQEDIVVGTPVAGRSRPELADVVGCLVNTVVLRTDVSGDPTFRELVDRARGVVLGALAHQGVPFERVVDEVRATRHVNRNPLFDVGFSLRPEVELGTPFPGAVAELVDLELGTAQVDLALECVEDAGEVRATLRYLTDLFDPATVAALGSRLVRLLDRATDDPDQPVSRIALLTPDEERALLAAEPGPEPARAELAQEPFDAHARAHPDDPAVRVRDQVTSYGELDAAAAEWARRLRRLGVGPESRVGVLLERSADLIAVLLGILKAGGAFVPMEPGVPAARVAGVLADAGAVVLLTRPDTATALAEESAVALPCPVLTVPADADAVPSGLSIEDGPEETVHSGQSESLAYVMFTSGSTGRPKGVAVEHRHFVSYLRAAGERLRPSRGDRHVMISTIAADICLTPLFVSLRTGGCLHLIPEDDAVDPAALAERFRDDRPEFLKIAPSHLTALLADPAAAAMLPTDTLVLSGEAVPWALVDRIRDLAPDVTILNEYGPTETVVASVVERFPVDSIGRVDGVDTEPATRPATVPIGRSLGANRSYVLDQHRRLVPPGMVGELYLGGAQVTRGYLGRPDLTERAFVPDPYADGPDARMYRTGDRARLRPDGRLEYLGRVDDQVKVRGFRVEPGEVANMLRTHPGLVDAVVLALPGVGGDHRLVGYVCPVEPAAPSTVDIGELRQFLRARVPDYLVPSAFVVVPAVPVTANGKVDRAALARLAPDPTGAGAEVAEPPATPLERSLAEIWSSLLGGRPVGRHDNFFDVGGHSLLLIRMQHLLQERLARLVPVVDLISHPTVSAQAAYLSGADPAGDAEDEGRARGQVRLAARSRRRAREEGE
jgi:amino acid adenylation domain-containing protein